MAKELDGTFITNFTKRELALTLFAGLQYLNEGSSYSELQQLIRTDDDELDDLRIKLTEFLESV